MSIRLFVGILSVYLGVKVSKDTSTVHDCFVPNCVSTTGTMLHDRSRQLTRVPQQKYIRSIKRGKASAEIKDCVSPPCVLSAGVRVQIDTLAPEKQQAGVRNIPQCSTNSINSTVHVGKKYKMCSCLNKAEPSDATYLGSVIIS